MHYDRMCSGLLAREFNELPIGVRTVLKQAAVEHLQEQKERLAREEERRRTFL